MPATKTTAPDVHAFEICFDEAVQAYEEILALRRKMKRRKTGSQADLDLLPDVAVCASVTAKTDTLLREIDAIEDSLPDEDE